MITGHGFAQHLAHVGLKLLLWHGDRHHGGGYTAPDGDPVAPGGAGLGHAVVFGASPRSGKTKAAKNIQWQARARRFDLTPDGEGLWVEGMSDERRRALRRARAYSDDFVSRRIRALLAYRRSARLLACDLGGRPMSDCRDFLDVSGLALWLRREDDSADAFEVWDETNIGGRPIVGRLVTTDPTGSAPKAELRIAYDPCIHVTGRFSAGDPEACRRIGRFLYTWPLLDLACRNNLVRRGEYKLQPLKDIQRKLKSDDPAKPGELAELRTAITSNDPVEIAGELADVAYYAAQWMALEPENDEPFRLLELGDVVAPEWSELAYDVALAKLEYRLQRGKNKGAERTLITAIVDRWRKFGLVPTEWGPIP